MRSGNRSDRTLMVVGIFVSTIGASACTRGSVHPNTDSLRDAPALYEFRIPVGAPFEEAFGATPVSVPLAMEAKGEAVAYRPDGRAYLTTGEGAMQPISQVACP